MTRKTVMNPLLGMTYGTGGRSMGDLPADLSQRLLNYVDTTGETVRPLNLGALKEGFSRLPKRPWVVGPPCAPLIIDSMAMIRESWEEEEQRRAAQWQQRVGPWFVLDEAHLPAHQLMSVGNRLAGLHSKHQAGLPPWADFSALEFHVARRQELLDMVGLPKRSKPPFKHNRLLTALESTWH